MDKKSSSASSKNKKEKKKKKKVASTLTSFSSMSLVFSSASTSKKFKENKLQEAIFYLTDSAEVFANFCRLKSDPLSNFPLMKSSVTREVKFLKVLDAELLPEKLFSVQSHDNSFVRSFGPRKNVVNPALITQCFESESAFVRVKLVDLDEPIASFKNTQEKLDRLPFVDSGFLTSVATCQVLKMRLKDGAFFLSYNGISIPEIKFGPYPPKVTIILEPLEAKNSSSDDYTEAEFPKFQRAFICEENSLIKAPIFYRSSAQHLDISKLGINVVEVHLSTLLEKGVLFIKLKEMPAGLTCAPKEQCWIDLFLAPWLTLENDLPLLPEEEEKDGKNDDQNDRDDPKNNQDDLKDVFNNETGNEKEDILKKEKQNQKDQNKKVKVLFEKKKPQKKCNIA